jgi:UDP-glucose 4-epimerase
MVVRLRVLVIGGAGFISSHLVDKLVRDGYRVRVVDNLSSGGVENIKHHLESGGVELIVGDLKDPQVALSSVYGELEEIPVDENAPIRPISVYGASKVACEALVHAYSKLYRVKAVVPRYANVVGPRLTHGAV